MDAHWFNKLLDLLVVQTNSENEKLMVLYIHKELGKLKLPYTIDAAGNIIVTKGKAKTYPCVTSHMDTVHNFANNFKLYKDTDNDDILFAMDNKKRVGIGGDDKCGVFACLYLLKIIPQIKVVFFSREEDGCKGSTGINKNFFADCRYLIQLDRRGNSDFIQTYWGNKTVSHEFSSEIGPTKKKYKYKNCTGTVTDVMKLWNNKVGVSCINLSCGYYKAHTNYEYVSINDLWHSIKFTESIINSMKPKKYCSLPPQPTVTKTTIPYAKSYNYSQCCKCNAWKKDTLLHCWNDNDKICFSCRRAIYDQFETKKLERKHWTEAWKGTSKNIQIFACFECGMTTDQMEKGHSLKYAPDGQLYCNNCTAVLFSSNKEPDQCFVCNKIIPKDHKIIERFGVRVCEDCACPSDTEIANPENTC